MNSTGESAPNGAVLSLSLVEIFRAAAAFACAIWDRRPYVMGNDRDPFDFVPINGPIGVWSYHLAVALQRPTLTECGWHQAIDETDYPKPVKDALHGLYQAIDWEKMRVMRDQRLPSSLRTTFYLLHKGIWTMYESLTPSEREAVADAVANVSERWGWQKPSNPDHLSAPGETASAPEQQKLQELRHGIIELTGRTRRLGLRQINSGQLESLNDLGARVAGLVQGLGFRLPQFPPFSPHQQFRLYGPASLPVIMLDDATLIASEADIGVWEREWGAVQIAVETRLELLAARSAPGKGRGETFARDGATPKGPAEERTAPMAEYLSARDLACHLGQPVDRVESFLRRFRDSHPDCFNEIDSRRKNEPRYLYRTKDVWPALQTQLKAWRRLTDG